MVGILVHGDNHSWNSKCLENEVLTNSGPTTVRKPEFRKTRLGGATREC